MGIATKTVNGALVYFEDEYKQRWVDALGEDVVKFISAPGPPKDDTSNDPTSFVNTEVGTNTVLSNTEAGTWLVITTGANAYDGVNLQLHGAAFQLESSKPCYFGIKCKCDNATKGDFLVGLCEVDTTLMATGGAHAVSVTDDGLYFYHLNDATKAYVANELDGNVTAVWVGDTHDTDYHVYEWYWDGDSLFAYFDDTLVTTITTGQAAVALTPSINVRAGDDGAEIFKIAWMRAIHCR
jgi:hypothetical protein